MCNNLETVTIKTNLIFDKPNLNDRIYDLNQFLHNLTDKIYSKKPLMLFKKPKQYLANTNEGEGFISQIVGFNYFTESEELELTLLKTKESEQIYDKALATSASITTFGDGNHVKDLDILYFYLTIK